MNASAPFFSWTCLFPDDAAYQCTALGPWAEEYCDPSGDAGGDRPRVLVTADPCASQLPDLAPYAGLVALNCRGVSDGRLRVAGFSYVRRFAVLPDASRSRWFIPLDGPALSAGAFCICAPFKTAAQLRHRGGRAAARLGLPLWYRDELCIAQRQTPPIEQAIQSLFPARPVRLALSSGTPPPAINRKISLAVLGPRGQALAFAKLPGPCPVSAHNVRHEAEVLSHLAQQRATRAPRLLLAGNVGTRYLAVFTPLQGRPTQPELTNAHRRFLAGLRSGDARPAGDTAFVRSLTERSRLLDRRPDLLAILRELLPRLRALRLPATTIHGDFVPWNLREYAGAIGAFDWEYAQTDGVPLIDETHHLLAVGYLLRKWTPEHAYRRLLDVTSVAPFAEFSPATVRALQMAYLLDYVLRLFGEGHGDNYPRVAWCRRILSYLAPAVQKGAAA
jgi:hypothetical protein